MAQPLNSNVPIINKDGTPTPYFVKILQDRGITVESLAATDITAGVGLSGGGNLGAPITIDLENTAVAAGAYTSANITVDAQGRITLAANDSGGGGATGEGSLTVPALTSYTWDNQGSASAVDNGNGINVEIPDPGGLQTRSLYRTMAAGDFDVKMRIKGHTNAVSSPAYGIIAFNSGSGKFLFFSYEPAGNTIYLQRWTSITNFNGTVVSRGLQREFNWFRMTRVGTTITAYHSVDGLKWIAMTVTEAEGTFVGTIDRVGFGCATLSGSVVNFVVQSITGL